MDSELSVRDRLELAVIDNMTRAGETAMVWGRDDCALWAVAPIRAILGYDPAAEFRGRYKTRIGAIRVLGRGGLPHALRRAARRHGWKKIAPADALAGDLGAAEINGVISMTSCRAPGWFVGRNENGFTALPAASQRMAWRVV